MSNQKVTNLPLEIKNGTCFEICQSNPNTLTHSFFKYPCKFIPEIPGWNQLLLDLMVLVQKSIH